MNAPPFPASADGPSLFAVAVPALAIAVLLTGAFAWGNHHLNRRAARPTRGAHAARTDSWRTPDGNAPRHDERKPAQRRPADRPSHRRAHRAAPLRRPS
nr:hypothetical protein KitaXyl93_68350 [Kitasatospora sp. Xyl93]